jgi:aconitate hydratase
MEITTMANSIQRLKQLEINGEICHYHSFDGLADIETLANWGADNWQDTDIAFVPTRVILQDFTGIPAVVDLAAMRYAIRDNRAK